MQTLRNREPKRKLLILTSTFPRWAGDTEPPFVFQLCSQLKAKYQIRVLAPHAPGCAVEETLNGIHVNRFRYCFGALEQLAYRGGILSNLKHRPWRCILVPAFLIAGYVALIRMLRRHQYDLVHAHWMIPQGLLAVLARPFAKSTPALLCTSHGGDVYGLRGQAARRLITFVLSRTDHLAAVSRAMRNDLLTMGLASDKISVIPMGVDLRNRFVPPKERRSSAALLFVGRLVEKKGVRYLLEAMPEVLEEHPAAALVVVGDGPEKKALAALAEKLGIRHRVTFAGSVANSKLPVFYQKSDVVIFPSVVAAGGDREGFGLVLVEALGCARAVVVTDLPAMRDIVADGKTALVVPQKSAPHLAEAVKRLLREPSLMGALGRAGRDSALGKFDWETIAARYIEIIDSLTKPAVN